jgi:uncharacterized protein (TIGR00369 family)
MDLRDDLRRPARSLEGRVVGMLADVAGASTAALALRLVATGQISISFFAPGRVGPIRATGIPKWVGRRGAVVEVEIVDGGNDDRVKAVALVTGRAQEPRRDGGCQRGSCASVLVDTRRPFRG